MERNSSNCKKVGLIIGVLTFVYSVLIAFHAFDLELLINHARYIIIYMIVIGLHIVSCASWLFGITKEKPMLMELSLLWWALHLLISACFLIAFTWQYTRDDNIYPYLIETIKLICLFVCYFITVKCYISTKKVADVKTFRCERRCNDQWNGIGEEQITLYTN